MAWHEAERVTTRRGIVCKVIGQQPDAIARVWSASRLNCTPEHSRRYSRRAVEHPFGSCLDVDDVAFVRTLRCGPHVREVEASSGAVGAAVRRRHRVRPRPNDVGRSGEYRNDTHRNPRLNEYHVSHAWHNPNNPNPTNAGLIFEHLEHLECGR
jgi:hypothetical protein